MTIPVIFGGFRCSVIGIRLAHVPVANLERATWNLFTVGSVLSVLSVASVASVLAVSSVLSVLSVFVRHGKLARAYPVYCAYCQILNILINTEYTANTDTVPWNLESGISHLASGIPHLGAPALPKHSNFQLLNSKSLTPPVAHYAATPRPVTQASRLPGMQAGCLRYSPQRFPNNSNFQLLISNSSSSPIVLK